MENSCLHFPPIDRKENPQKSRVSSMTWPQRIHPRQIRLALQPGPQIPGKKASGLAKNYTSKDNRTAFLPDQPKSNFAPMEKLVNHFNVHSFNVCTRAPPNLALSAKLPYRKWSRSARPEEPVATHVCHPPGNPPESFRLQGVSFPTGTWGYSSDFIFKSRPIVGFKGFY